MTGAHRNKGANPLVLIQIFIGQRAVAAVVHNDAGVVPRMVKHMRLC